MIEVEKTPYLLYFRYNLLAVSNHMGRLGGGHYTANVLHTPTNQWLNFNDSFVSLSLSYRSLNRFRSDQQPQIKASLLQLTF